MATLDLCRIDLYRGECETVKAGGAAGFIKRSDRVEKIQSRQLPLGMSASEDISEKKWQLNSGDLVILVSDGVVQNWPCGDGEYLLEQKIASLNVSSPVDLANLILRYAIRQCGGKIRDDMTVLVTGICNWFSCAPNESAKSASARALEFISRKEKQGLPKAAIGFRVPLTRVQRAPSAGTRVYQHKGKKETAGWI